MRSLNQQRFDTAVAKQLFLERAKLGMISSLQKDYDAYIAALVSFAIKQATVNDFSAISRRTVKLLLADFKRYEVEIRPYILKQLLAKIDQQIYAELSIIFDDEPEVTVESLSSPVLNSFVGGTNTTLSDYIKSHFVAIQNKFTRELVTGYQLSSPKSELLLTLSLLGEQKSSFPTVVRTASQVTSSVVADKIALSSFPKYVWISILDARTSEICRSLDGRVFVRGKGPLPPAHPNCRSTTAGYEEGQGDLAVESFGKWLGRQSKEQQADLLSNEPITFAQYVRKVKEYGTEAEDQ